MKWRNIAVGAALLGAATLLSAQQEQKQTTTTTTTLEKSDRPGRANVTGEVVQYDMTKHTIVIRKPDQTVITYTIGPSVAVPAGVRAGRTVTIYSEPGESGSVIVTRIVTVEPDGSVTQTERRQVTTSSESAQTPDSAAAVPRPSERTAMSSAPEETGAPATVTGTVSAYEPGVSITLIGPDKKTTVYTLAPESRVPAEVALGKRVTVTTTTVSGSKTAVVKMVTVETRTKTTKRSEHE